MRQSYFIRRKQATNFAPAIRLADRLGCPLNRFVTINFTHTQCSPQAVSAAFGRLRANHFTPWYRRPGKRASSSITPAAFIWVIENTNGHVALHWLVHIPDGRLKDFIRRIPVWLVSVTGGLDCAESALSIKPAHTPFGARKYMLKGIDPAYAQFYKINAIPQGLVYGKRCGFSRSLGPTACREARTYHTQMVQDGYRQPYGNRFRDEQQSTAQ